MAAAGYYRVELIEGPTYRVDPTRRAVIRHVAKKALLGLLRRKYVAPPDLPPLPRGPSLDLLKARDGVPAAD